jgi:nitrate reductase beta subunit
MLTVSKRVGNLIILDYLTHVWLRLAGEYQQQDLVYYHDSLIPMVFKVHQTSFRILNTILAPHITFLRVPVSCSATMCSRCEGEVQG